MGPRICLVMLLCSLVASTLGQSPMCSQEKCKTDCQYCQMDQKVSDPEDCKSYYLCDGNGGIKFPQSLDCAAGNVFDPITHACVSGNSCTNCPRCFFDCSTSINGIISVFSDCSAFIACNGNSPGYTQSCPASMPFFDGLRCQTSHERCCSCHPYCYPGQENTLVPDPKDCRNYYLCLTTGEPTISGTCDPGQHFDIAVHDCTLSPTCNTQCKNVVGSDGCINPYTCVEKGYFPKCPSKCMPQYYHCSQISDTYVQSESCPDGYVFHPDTRVCVKKDMCHY